jgi:hypothetical protein
MRDWIGTGVSLLGFVVVVAALVRSLRARRRREPAGAVRRSLLELCAGLIITEAGQLIRASGWVWAIPHLIAVGLVTAGAVFLYREGRRAGHAGE